MSKNYIKINAQLQNLRMKKLFKIGSLLFIFCMMLLVNDLYAQGTKSNFSGAINVNKYSVVLSYPVHSTYSIGSPFLLAPKEIGGVGYVNTIAGSGAYGVLNSTRGIDAQFTAPSGIVIDQNKNVYVSDKYNHSIRKITPAGAVTLLAGSSIAASGFVNGTGTSARFNYPIGLAIDKLGNIYVADSGNNAIRKITPAGVVTTVVGNGIAGDIDGSINNVRFNGPTGVAVDTALNIFVADCGNNKIKLIPASGNVITYAGTGQAGSQNTASVIDSTTYTYSILNATFNHP
jgi:sugar lactone lactonase YvrE